MTSPTPLHWTIPALELAMLVDGHLSRLWVSSESSDPDDRTCCIRCCGPCCALERLLSLGQLDAIEAVYIEAAGPSIYWDEDNQQIDREWLARVWDPEACPNGHDWDDPNGE